MGELPRRTLGPSGIEVPDRGDRLQQLRRPDRRGPQRSGSSRRRSTRASRSSTPPTSTAAVAARRSSGGRCATVATRRSSPPSSAARWAHRSAAAARGAGSCRRSRTACAAWTPTTSTSTSTTSSTRRPRWRRPWARSTSWSAAGKVLAIGCSNYDGAQIDEAHRIATEHGWATYVTAQNEYSLLKRDQVEESVMPAAERLRHGHPPVLPAVQRPPHRQVPPRRAAGGRHAPRHGQQPGARPDDRQQPRRRRGAGAASPANAASRSSTSPSAGCVAQPQVTSVIAGATSPEQVAANARAGAVDADRRRTSRRSTGSRSRPPSPERVAARSSARIARLD